MPHRILYIHHASVLGGAEISLLELVRGLDRQLFEPAAMLPVDGPLADALRELRVPVHPARLRRLKRTLSPFTLAADMLSMHSVRRQLRDLMVREHIRLVHCNGTVAQLFVGSVPRRLGIPCVWHVRDLSPLGSLRARLESNAAKIIAVSRAVAAGVDSPKTLVVHNGVDLDRFHPGLSGEAVRREFGIAPEAPVIGMAAQWAPWKRHDVFLATARLVAAKHPECRFLIVGDDLFGDHPKLSRAIRETVEAEPLRGRAILAGRRLDMPEVLAAMDILALPSGGEPFGRVLIEAMAAGRPVVAVRGAGPDEIVTPDCGVLLARSEPDSMAAELIRLIEEPPRRRQMGQAGRRHAEQRFSSQKTAQAIQSIYGELLR